MCLFDTKKTCLNETASYFRLHKMTKRMRFAVLIICMILGILACKSDYQTWVADELARGERRDDLFLNLRLGMPKKAFLDTCWQLNRRGEIRHGLEHLTVCHSLGSKMRQPALLNFYPNFSEKGQISEVPILFTFENWSPWRAELKTDSLRAEAMRFFKTAWGGADFRKMEFKESGPAWVKIDGNRQVVVFEKYKDPEKVRALVSDLTIVKK